MDHRSIYELFEATVASYPEHAAFRYKKDGAWVSLTWTGCRETVRRVAKSLIALDVDRGDRVSILSQSRLEWILCDIGIVSSGAVTVGIYPSSLAADCKYLLEHSDSAIVIVENEDQLRKIESVRDKLPGLRHVVIFDGPSVAPRGVLGWDEFLAKGDRIPDRHYEDRGKAIGPDDLASIVYTSGTTGLPKGTMLTHHNLLFTCESARQCLPVGPETCTLFFLPLAHVFARLIAYMGMIAAYQIAFAESIATVPENLKEVRPHFIASVPRIYEKFYDKVISGVESSGGVKRKLFNWAVGVGMQASKLRQQKRPIPLLLGLRHAVARALVLHKIPDALGGRMDWAVSGAAPLNKAIAEFFDACGLTILEGIGMTENTSFSNVNRLDDNKFGTVGPTGPGIEQKIAEDGEVLFRGPNVMKGYFKDEEATAEAIDGDGWLHSGDIGEIDEDGFLKITDRKKDLIITAGGKNVAPQRIERIMRTSHYIAQVVAYGDKKKYITALITLDPEAMAEWAARTGLGDLGLEELASRPEVRELIRVELEQRNRQLASFETVKKFHILPRDLSVEEGEITPSLKIRRKAVIEKFGNELEALYRE
jgi:long-chain acyl-CoA synthetase